MTRRKTSLILAAAMTMTALSAQADRADHPAPLLTVLSAIDLVPTADQVRKVAGAIPEAALFKVALDTDLPLYERRRAASMLSMFPGPAAESYLTLLATSMPEDRLRWIATYTYVRTFGPLAPERALAFAELVLESPIPLDRDAAVRGLRWVPRAAADQVLRQAEAREKDDMVRAAIRHVIQKRR